jgi:2-keto-4-pentenoate hydratase/2-oxohepta-3-ene-1,7-dioic acid hydratase in catechol pathway
LRVERASLRSFHFTLRDAGNVVGPSLAYGTYLVTGVDGMNLDLWTKLNGQVEQQGNTSDMLFPVNDLLATGTPRFLNE